MSDRWDRDWMTRGREVDRGITVLSMVGGWV